MTDFNDGYLRIDSDHLRAYIENAEVRVTLLQWRILLALLRMHPEPVTSGELERIVNNGANGKSSTGIYTYICRLRKLIGVEYIGSSTEGYQFHRKLPDRR